MNILDEANKIINERSEEKERQYGPMGEGLERAAMIASGMTGKDFTADDIFADVMDVALHRGQQDFPVVATAAGFFRLNVGLQVGNGLFHDTGGLHDLGQEHFSFTKEVAHGIHPIH